MKNARTVHIGGVEYILVGINKDAGQFAVYRDGTMKVEIFDLHRVDTFGTCDKCMDNVRLLNMVWDQDLKNVLCRKCGAWIEEAN